MAADQVRVVVAVDPDRWAEALAALREAGLTVSREFPATATLAGTVGRTRMSRLAALPGVVAVEPDRTLRIAPPGSPVQ